MPCVGSHSNLNPTGPIFVTKPLFEVAFLDSVGGNDGCLLHGEFMSSLRAVSDGWMLGARQNTRPGIILLDRHAK